MLIVSIKALIVVLAVSVATLAFYRKAFVDLLGKKRFTRFAIAWIAAACCAFLLTQYWLFFVLFAVLLTVLAMGESNKAALFTLLVAALPAYGLAVPGFFGINRFIDTNPQLVLILALLVPLMLMAKHIKPISKLTGGADKFVFAWIVLQLILSARAPTFTHMLRVAVESILAIAPIYYVLSRSPKTIQDIRAMTAAFVLAIIILCATTIPETTLNWHFYTTAATNWVGDIYFSYKLRDGALRATASSINPIVWGFMAMCGLGLALATLNDRLSALHKYTGFGVLAIGLAASLSRGPWIGAAAMFFFFVAFGERKFQRLAQLGAVGAMGAAAAAATPFGQRILGLLPFIGDSAGDTIDYRQLLLDASISVISENPVFGSQDFLSHPRLQALRQGEGIIDIVNSYVGVALESGLIGLAIYLGIFLSVVLALRRAMKSARTHSTQIELYARAYLATLLGAMITLFTTSTVEQMPYIIWMLLAGGVAIVRVERHAREAPHLEPAIDVAMVENEGSPKFDWK